MARLMTVGIRLNLPAWENRIVFIHPLGAPGRAEGDEQGRAAFGHLSVHNDVNANPIGLDECAGGGAIYLVILGKPRMEGPSSPQLNPQTCPGASHRGNPDLLGISYLKL